MAIELTDEEREALEFAQTLMAKAAALHAITAEAEKESLLVRNAETIKKLLARASEQEAHNGQG